jgi:hypothetical protein
MGDVAAEAECPGQQRVQVDGVHVAVQLCHAPPGCRIQRPLGNRLSVAALVDCPTAGLGSGASHGATSCATTSSTIKCFRRLAGPGEQRPARWARRAPTTSGAHHKWRPTQCWPQPGSTNQPCNNVMGPRNWDSNAQQSTGISAIVEDFVTPCCEGVHFPGPPNCFAGTPRNPAGFSTPYGPCDLLQEMRLHCLLDSKPVS